VISLIKQHIARKKYEKEETKRTNASANLVQYRFNIREGSPEGIRMMEERICSVVKPWP